MFVQELINTTAGATVQQGVNNSNNLSDILCHDDKYGFNRHVQHSIRFWVIVIMAMMTSVGHVLALFVQYNSLRKRNFLWLLYLVQNVLFSGVFLEYIPMVTQLNSEVEVYDLTTDYITCLGVQYLRPYFLTFSNLGMVTLAFASYMIIVKGALFFPVNRLRLIVFLVFFYFICCIPVLIMYSVHTLFRLKPNCDSYYFQNLPFSGATRLEMMILLVFSYLLPFLAIIGSYSKILYHILSDSSYLYANKKEARLRSDYDHIKMAFFMCLIYILTNVPYVVQLVIAIFFQSVNINPNTAVLVEILSISNLSLNAYIYMIFKFKLSYFKDLMFKLRQWHCNRSKLGNKDIDLHPNGYELSQKLVKKVLLN